ncbi:hypothetical protein F4810DRAFT_644039 [Camillea tinctor]|nr:hypothetical protein F4810DRAFT_644039 [Camillea tinctor]
MDWDRYLISAGTPVGCFGILLVMFVPPLFFSFLIPRLSTIIPRWLGLVFSLTHPAYFYFFLASHFIPSGFPFIPIFLYLFFVRSLGWILPRFYPFQCISLISTPIPSLVCIRQYGYIVV